MGPMPASTTCHHRPLGSRHVRSPPAHAQPHAGTVPVLGQASTLSSRASAAVSEAPGFS